MLPLSLTFEMTDPVATQASRESWRALARTLFTPGTMALIGIVTVIFVLAWRQHAHWLWVLTTAIGPALYLLLASAWAVGLWWLPHATRKKLAHLPHRRVVVELTESELILQTATERLAVSWSEVKEVRELPSFLVVCLRSGAEVPLPRAALPAEAVAALQAQPSRESRV